jgi:hypothetical protein
MTSKNPIQKPDPDRYDQNATVIERLMWYQQNGDHDGAKALASVCDGLEEGFLWDIAFFDESLPFESL